MNWVDLIILLVLATFALNGLTRGFFIQLIDIIGFLTSLILALIFYPQVAQLLINTFSLPKIAAMPVGFLLIWLITETILFASLSGHFKKHLLPLLNTPVNKFLGFIPSIANGLLFLAFLLLFVVSLPIRPDIKRDILSSKIGSPLVDKAEILEKPFNNIFGPIAKQSLTFLTVKQGAKEEIPLEFTQSELFVDFAAEQEMFKLVNQERVKFGVIPLIWNESQARVGRAHSEDMFKRGYFSHYSPEDKDVADRLDKAGIHYTAAGENLALAPDTLRAHNGLMGSEGHRRNILDPTFQKIGIGAIDGGVYGKMFTQVFTD